MNSASRFVANMERWLDKLVYSGLTLLALTMYLYSDVRSTWRAVLLFLVCVTGMHLLVRAKPIWERLQAQSKKMLLLWLAFCLFILFTAYTGHTFPNSQQELLLSFLLPSSLPFLASIYINSKKKLQIIGLAFLGGLFISIFRNTEQYAKEWIELGGLPNDIHLHRHYADGLVFGVPFLLAAITLCKPRVPRYLLSLVLVVTLLMNLLTGARGAWLSTAVSMLCFLLLLGNRKLLYALPSLGLAMLLALATLTPSEIVTQKIRQGFDSSQRTTGTWGPTLDMMADRLILGYGFGAEVYHSTFNKRAPEEPNWNPKTSQGPHNAFLAIGFAAGLPGLGLFILAIFTPLLKILHIEYQKRKANLQQKYTYERISGIALCSIFFGAILTQGMFEGRNWPPIAFWLGLCLAWIDFTQKNDGSNP